MKIGYSLSILICFIVLSVACNKSETDIKKGEEGEKSYVVLSITPGGQSRSSEGEEEGLEGKEGEIVFSDGLKVYVFNSNGTLDFSSENSTNGRLLLTPSGNTFVSDKIEITSGEKYFFVFANDGASNGKIVAPSYNTELDLFIRQVLNIGFNAEDIPDIAGDTKFLLGTLWKEEIKASTGGTEDEPIKISLKIGRLVSKINLTDVKNVIDDEADLKGSFEDPKYRLGTVARKIFTVGNHDGDKLPSSENDVLVKSAVHDANIWTTDNDANFIDYYGTWNEIKESFYATENTTAKDMNSYQYFGNTTFLQIETTYVPAAEEIYDPETMNNNNSLISGNTFWTARVIENPTAANSSLAGKRIILNKKPEMGNTHPDIQWEAEFPEYNEGKNYHKFPIFDPKEGDDVNRNRVLRNHYYEFVVSEFLDLGSPSSTVDPTEPIPSATTIVINVTVKNWDKVVGTTPVG